MPTVSKPRTSLKPGTTCAGFLVTRIRPLDNPPSLAIEARHQYSGAELLYLYSFDEENLFAAAFRTPPPDNTGVAHILEHSVLGGSRKYPVKEPFVEMLKMSMATFINAMTYPDKTVYPVASNVENDFFNLIDVYCDAVLHPNITPITLQQEGHHLAFTRPGDITSPLTIKGIVYNEMKGAYSDLDSLIDRTSSQFLFPDSPYGMDSGGSPDAIPSLSYAAFKDFYDRYYHPANGKFFVHSCVSPEKTLAFLDERLQQAPVPPSEIDSNIPRQPRWSSPRETVVSYPIASEEDPENKAAVTINWLTGDLSEPLTDLAMEVVDRLLLGHAAAPLRKTLIDSQLGHDLTSSGYDNGRMETTFHVGLKGTRVEARGEIISLVNETLSKVVEEGFDEAAVKRAFHQLEYAHREIQSLYPLRLMDWVYSAWMYDYDPLTYLETEDQLAQLRDIYAANPSYFSDLVRERLLENEHRVDVLLKPVPGLQEEREIELQDQLEKVRGEKTEEELLEINKQDQVLEKLQSQPNSPEDVARLPQLHINDLPAEPREIDTDTKGWQDNPPMLVPRIETNGINYLMLAFNLENLPRRLWEYVPMFSVLLTRMGTNEHSYSDVAERIAENTGGLHAQTFVGTGAESPQDLLTYLTVGAKTLGRTLPETLNIIRELLFELDLQDMQRLYDVVKQVRERSVSHIIPGGHRFVARHAARKLSPAAAVSEMFSGLPQIRTVDSLTRNFKRDIGTVVKRLEEIRGFLLNRDLIRVSYTGSSEQEHEVRNWLDSLPVAESLHSVDDVASFDPVSLKPGNHRDEGLAMEADVAFCATVIPAPHSADPRSAAVQVLAHLLSFDYMWEEIRAKGGAYGGSCSYNASQGTLALLSYRDPHIARTLGVYQNLLDYVRNHTWTEEDIQRAVIGCARGHQKPIRPGWATNAALWRQIGGFTPEIRREQRRQLLAVTPAQVKKVAAEVLEKGFECASTCVLASRGKLESENSGLARQLEIQPVLFPR